MTDNTINNEQQPQQNKSSFKDLPISKVLPNLVTMMAAASGITSIRLSADGNWVFAIVAIILAAFFDGMDGRVARMLDSQSKIGAELDSLSDFVCFGVAPGMMLFFWAMKQAIGIGWILSLVYAMCCVFRLARFNTMLNEEHPPYWDYFFVGLPAPGGAILALAPVVFYLYFTGFGPEYAAVAEFIRSPLVGGIVLFISGFLMASRIPTLSLKKLKISERMLFPVVIVFAVIAGGIFVAPWLVLGTIAVLYFCSVPITILVFLKMKAAYNKKQEH